MDICVRVFQGECSKHERQSVFIQWRESIPALLVFEIKQHSKPTVPKQGRNI